MSDGESGDWDGVDEDMLQPEGKFQEGACLKAISLS
jgi:hypothetical protein